MTITTNDDRDEYTATGGQTVFNYTFKIYASTDLNVYQTPENVDYDDDAYLTTAYSVTGVGNSAGGTIILNSGATAGDRITIVSAVPSSRTTDYQVNGDFKPATVNDDFDRLVSIAKQAEGLARRSPKFIESRQGVSEFSLPKPVASAFWRVNSTATGMESYYPGSPPAIDGIPVATYAAARELDSSTLTDGQTLIITEPGKAGWGVLKNVTGHGLTDIGDDFIVIDANWYWRRSYRGDDYTEGFDNPYFNPQASSKVKVVLDGSTTPSLGHRHFGGMVRTRSGRLVITYRLAPEHALTASTSIKMVYSDDEGATWSSEQEIIPAVAGYDNREQSLIYTSSGRIVMAYNQVVVPSGTGNLFRVVYSDDEGVNWSSPVTFVTNTESYSRIFGQGKEVPSDNASYDSMLIVPAYYANGANFDSVYYRSYDNGESWSSPVTIVSDATGYNEAAISWISDQSILAVIRSTNGLTLFTSVDAGSSWTNQGVVPNTSTDSQVAPSLNVFYEGSRQYVLLSYCNRSTDQTVFRVDWTGNFFQASPPDDVFGEVITIGDADMVNASGYQSGIFYPNGTYGYLEFKEYNSPDDYSDVRFGVAYPKKWVGGQVRNKLFFRNDTAYSAVDAMINGEVSGSTNPVTATNTGTTSNRIHHALLQSGVLVGGLGTSADGPSLVDENSSPQITVDIARNKAFINSGANIGVVPDADRTGYVNTVTPGSSTAAHTCYVGTTSSRAQIEFRNPNGKVGSINTSGTATAYNTSSDPRLKTEFKKISEKELLKAFKNIANAVGKFEFKSNLGVEVLGFDAHKILDIDGLGCEIATPGNGPRELDIGEKYQDEEECESLVTPASVDHSKAVPYLVKVVELLVEKIDNLEHKLNG